MFHMNAFYFRSNYSDVIELKFIINKKGMNSTVDLLQNIKKQIHEKEDGKIVLSFSMAEGNTAFNCIVNKVLHIHVS